jgi:hypothetical protein
MIPHLLQFLSTLRIVKPSLLASFEGLDVRQRQNKGEEGLNSRSESQTETDDHEAGRLFVSSQFPSRSANDLRRLSHHFNGHGDKVLDRRHDSSRRALSLGPLTANELAIGIETRRCRRQ